MSGITFRKFLQDEFERRTAHNQHYSMRAFARDLRLDAASLSGILAGKRPLTAKAAKQVLEQLKVDPELKLELLMNVLDDLPPNAPPEYSNLDSTRLSPIVGWEHFAILSLMQTRDFRSANDWIALRLGIDTETVAQALANLEHAGLISVHDGQLRAVEVNVASTTDIPSKSIREGLRQYIQKSIEALEQTPVEARDITGMTMAINPRKLPEAKRMIASFRRRLCNLLEKDTSELSEVYRLNIQLFPLSNSDSRQTAQTGPK